MVSVGIYGASGYMGGEALRILHEHPEVKIAWATSRSGRPPEFFHRNLYGAGFDFIDPKDATPCDVVFLSLPSGTAMKITPELLKSGTRIIDLGADFRLKDRTTWERVYHNSHPSWELAEEAVYGIPELHREDIESARLVANPGCFASAAILGLTPLISANIIDTNKIVVDGLSGTTGMGAELHRTAHHPEIGNNVFPYNYGIPELHREDIESARLVANPGCFASAAILGLTPLISANIIDTNKIVVDGLSGTTGMGAELHRTAHHPEIGNNVFPYNVIDHRHTYEMEQELASVGGSDITIHFTPSYIPITRGILAICHAYPIENTSRESLLELFRNYYEGEYFVRVFDMPKDPESSWEYLPYPSVSAVSRTNFCHIGLDYDDIRNRIVVFSVLDSIGKGGAHAGVQNLNIMFGLKETTGLERLGLHPY